MPHRTQHRKWIIAIGVILLALRLFREDLLDVSDLSSLNRVLHVVPPLAKNLARVVHREPAR